MLFALCKYYTQCPFIGRVLCKYTKAVGVQLVGSDSCLLQGVIYLFFWHDLPARRVREWPPAH
jgi:hypothetical protein